MYALGFILLIHTDSRIPFVLLSFTTLHLLSLTSFPAPLFRRHHHQHRHHHHPVRSPKSIAPYSTINQFICTLSILQLFGHHHRSVSNPDFFDSLHSPKEKYTFGLLMTASLSELSTKSYYVTELRPSVYNEAERGLIHVEQWEQNILLFINPNHACHVGEM